MKALVNRIMKLTAGSLVLGTIAFGQTLMTAHVPFDFHTGNANLAAGNYIVEQYRQASGAAALRIRHAVSLHAGYMPSGISDYSKTGKSAMEFRCVTDGGCSLSAVVTPKGTVTYPNRSHKTNGKAVAFISIPLEPSRGE